jgi:hypothetical protein
MLKKDAKKIVHGLTRTSKMPGYTYSLPAWECKTGSKLRKIPGTPCFGCYAMKGNYTRYPNIKKAQYRRLKSLEDQRWVQAMTVLVTGFEVFRWHDAGDIQSVDHLRKIFEVCNNTPGTRHWLPTQERAFLMAIDPGEVPANLVIRLSSSKINGGEPNAWTHSSSVVTDDAQRTCPAPDQGGKCGSCRACWSPAVKHVKYGKH